MDERQTSTSEQCKKARHPITQSAMLNGSGHSLVSPPTSPGTMSISSSYENTSPPFSPLSTPYVVSSPGACLDSTNTHSTSYTNNIQAPVPQPRTFASKASSSNGGLKDQESTRFQKALTETPSSPATNRRGESPHLAHGLSSGSVSFASRDLGRQVNARLPFSSSTGSSSPRSSVSSSVHETSSSLQPHSRALLPPDSPQSTRRGVEPSSMRELPPLSPSTARRGVLGVPVLPGALPGVPLTSRGQTVPESPRLQRRATAEEEVRNLRLHARSPSPVSALLKDQSSGKQKGGLTPALGSQTGVSPLTSPPQPEKEHQGASAGSAPYKGTQEQHFRGQWQRGRPAGVPSLAKRGKDAWAGNAEAGMSEHVYIYSICQRFGHTYSWSTSFTIKLWNNKMEVTYYLNVGSGIHFFLYI